MPKSRRNRQVSLTNVKAKGTPAKNDKLDQLRDALGRWKHVYVMKYDNTRTSKVRAVRMHFKESWLFMGKNTIAQVALGRTPEDEFQDNLRHISAKLTNNAALFFTSRPRKEVEEYFKNLSVPDYAKGGDKAPETVTLEPGYVFSKPASMLDQLRTLGAVVEIEDGKIVLKNQFTAAKKGVVLTPEQAKMLTHLEKKLGTFKLTLSAFWSDGAYEELL